MILIDNGKLFVDDWADYASFGLNVELGLAECIHNCLPTYHTVHIKKITQFSIV